MTVLWTMIMILSPFSPSPDTIRELCTRTGGTDIKVVEGSVRNERTGQVHITLIMHCVAPKGAEKEKVRA